MNKDESKEILDYLKRIDESINGPRTRQRPPKDKRPLSDRVDSIEKKVGTLETKVDKLDDRVSEVQLGLATLAADTKADFKRIDERFNQVDARFERVDRRFDKVDRDIKSARVQVVDLVGRVHEELAGRVVDLELPGPGRKGNGGRGSGSGGVPLAS
jgi:uncharacterized coiled-coil DUF342 family protein